MIIYKLENKITKSVYVGKTNNLERRMREHKSASQNKLNPDYNLLLYKKIREYGWKNFEASIIERCDNWEERERYWIKYYNSFKGKGYNLTYGGDGVEQKSIYEEIQHQIKDLLKNSNKSYKEIQKEMNISSTSLSNINNGLLFKDNSISYPIREYLNSDETLIKLKDLLENSSLSLQAIADKMNLSLSGVKKINSGEIRNDHIFNSYPVRKITPQKKKALAIIKMLKETDLSYADIASVVQVSKQTVGRVNRGESHKNSNLKYPIR